MAASRAIGVLGCTLQSSVFLMGLEPLDCVITLISLYIECWVRVAVAVGCCDGIGGGDNLHQCRHFVNSNRSSISNRRSLFLRKVYTRCEGRL